MTDGEYTITVKFTRDRAEDERYASPNTGEHLTRPVAIREFRDELQSAFDRGLIGGTFEIVGCDLPAVREVE